MPPTSPLRKQSYPTLPQAKYRISSLRRNRGRKGGAAHIAVSPACPAPEKHSTADKTANRSDIPRTAGEPHTDGQSTHGGVGCPGKSGLFP
ncbi:hypothetical protein [Treponema pedis]|uniref:Uncharacterized protein n=1 Tax=Treponema pedis TaxID=409322 RepID=A0A7S7AXP4_9SPIR|nr:hypothetical protein [Treponema pedis]QOW61381.1 hypothetical protein IFE08_03040 [Treponema pedis]